MYRDQFGEFVSGYWGFFIKGLTHFFVPLANILINSKFM